MSCRGKSMDMPGVRKDSSTDEHSQAKARIANDLGARHSCDLCSTACQPPTPLYVAHFFFGLPRFPGVDFFTVSSCPVAFDRPRFLVVSTLDGPCGSVSSAMTSVFFALPFFLGVLAVDATWVSATSSGSVGFFLGLPLFFGFSAVETLAGSAS